MSLMAVEVCIWHFWLCRSVYGIYGCGGLYMGFMVLEFNISHSWLWRSIYGIYGCRVQYMAFMAVEVCMCQGPIYVMDGIRQLMSIHIVLYFF